MLSLHLLLVELVAYFTIAFEVTNVSLRKEAQQLLMIADKGDGTMRTPQIVLRSEVNSPLRAQLIIYCALWKCPQGILACTLDTIYGPQPLGFVPSNGPVSF